MAMQLAINLCKNSFKMPYFAILIASMVLMYQFPGIALWLPDYLFGTYVPR
jgi:TRAP-type mannitol/chloroaromatic compound transport system permease large subunit